MSGILDETRSLEGITDRQKLVLQFICESIDTRGYPPTLREIGMRMGIRSTNGVNDHLRALEKKGLLTREDMKSRTLRPTNRTLELFGRSDDARPSDDHARLAQLAVDDEMIDIPILGRVAAGLLAEAIENPEDSVRIGRMMVGAKPGDRDVFGLRISGDSMIEAGIHHGDYVFIKKQLVAPRGAIVIALVGDEATCKYYFPEQTHIRLQPANSSMAPILIPKTDWRETQILGIVVGVYRKMK